MTSREQAAFDAGIRAAIDMARTAAVNIEIRPDARSVRQQAAAAALQDLGDGLRAAFLDKPADPEACSPPVKIGDAATSNLLPERAPE